MRVLFSPSEAKSDTSSDTKLDKNCFKFAPELFDKRSEAMALYAKMQTSQEAMAKAFGLKPPFKELELALGENGCIKSVLRYQGVAYNALKYALLDKNAQKWIDENVLIFSNLFGPVLAGDYLPLYKLKQGERLEGVALESFYKKHFSKAIDEWLKDNDVLDLRAGFYTKFYTLKQPYISFKFIKDNKVVSHYAKHYRGIALKEIAKAGVKNADELMELKIDGLSLVELLKTGSNTQIVAKIE